MAIPTDKREGASNTLITDAGKKVLDAEFERLEEMVENGKKYILR